MAAQGHHEEHLGQDNPVSVLGICPEPGHFVGVARFMPERKQWLKCLHVTTEECFSYPRLWEFRCHVRLRHKCRSYYSESEPSADDRREETPQTLDFIKHVFI